MLLTNNPTKVFSSVEKANAVAKSLYNCDPDWDYIVREDMKGTGKAIIEVYDEEKVFISNWKTM